MFQRILVPLDGSTHAERALPMAAQLGRASGGSIILLQVVVSPSESWVYRSQSMALTRQSLEAQRAAEGLAYLASVSQLQRLAGVAIETLVCSGAGVAATILDVAHSHDVDLIVMCSRGYTGFKRWALGSVAQQVARKTPVPVLVLDADGGKPLDLQPGESHPVRVLVPLDGSSLAEEALVPAVYLSTALSAPLQGALHLMQVIRLPTDNEYGQRDNIARARRKALSEAHVYLRTVKQRLRHGDLAHLNPQISSSVAVNRDVAKLLMSIAEHDESLEDVEGFNKRCDVIALATHGRSGLERWVRGSVTERLLGATKLPLLIVRPASIRDGVTRETEATHERPGKTTGAQIGETERTAAQVPSGVGLL
jgi:nucleotide-binding universal stress UspA family protein